jgi:hypothetical protein
MSPFIGIYSGKKGIQDQIKRTQIAYDRRQPIQPQPRGQRHNYSPGPDQSWEIRRGQDPLVRWLRPPRLRRHQPFSPKSCPAAIGPSSILDSIRSKRILIPWLPSIPPRSPSADPAATAARAVAARAAAVPVAAPAEDREAADRAALALAMVRTRTRPTTTPGTLGPSP